MFVRVFDFLIKEKTFRKLEFDLKASEIRGEIFEGSGKK